VAGLTLGGGGPGARVIPEEVDNDIGEGLGKIVTGGRKAFPQELIDILCVG
jgi:hypothetical protein